MSDALEQEIRILRSQFWSDRDPSGRGFVPLADAYRRAGDLEQASELLEDGLERHPDFASAHVVAAWLAAARNDEEAARASFQRVLELDAENIVALRSLGLIARLAGDLESARGYVGRLAELEPDDPKVAELLRDIESESAAAGGEASTVGAADIDLAEADLELPPADRALADAFEDEPSGLASDEATDAEAPDALADAESASADDALDLAEAASELEAEDWRLEDDEGGDEAGEVYTATMAEVYVRQGLLERAVEVYGHLVESEPENEELRSRLEEVRRLAASGGEGGVEVPEAPGAEEEGVAAPVAAPGSGSVGDYFSELLAWTPGKERETVDEEAELSDEPAEASGAAVEPARSEDEELDDAWALADEAPAPAEAPGADAEEIAVEVADEVLEAEVDDDEIEPALAPVDELTLGEDEDEEGRPEAVPIESLAPDVEADAVEVLGQDATPEAVTGESLAPEDAPEETPVEAVPIGSLAPDPGEVGDAVPIESLAPESATDEVDPEITGVLDSIDALGGGGDSDEEDLDDFQKWLESMKP